MCILLSITFSVYKKGDQGLPGQHMVVKSSFLVGFDGAVDDQQGEKRERGSCKNFPFNGPSPFRAGLSPRPYWIRPLKGKFFFCEVP